MHDFGSDSPTFNPFHIWGTREREVMVVGAGGARLFSGGRWNDAPPPQNLGQGLWGCDDSYFAGLYGGGVVGIGAPPVIGRYRGGAWEDSGAVPEGNVQFSAISGAANDDVFAGGVVNGANRSVAWHFDGTAWTDLALTDSPGLQDIVALGGGQALATGPGTDGNARVWRYDGAAWSVSGESGLLGLSAATADDVLGHDALFVHQFDGVQWTDPFPLPLDGPLAAKSLTGIWGSGASDLPDRGRRIDLRARRRRLVADGRARRRRTHAECNLGLQRHRRVRRRRPGANSGTGTERPGAR